MRSRQGVICFELRLDGVSVRAPGDLLLYESGPRKWHGNFLWTSYNGIFLLMFASILFLLEQYVRELRHGYGSIQALNLRFSRRFAVALLLLGLHLLSGIAYYWRFTLNL